MVLEDVSEREGVVDGVYYCREMNNTALFLLFFLTLPTVQMHQYYHVTKNGRSERLGLIACYRSTFFNDDEAGLYV